MANKKPKEEPVAIPVEERFFQAIRDTIDQFYEDTPEVQIESMSELKWCNLVVDVLDGAQENQMMRVRELEAEIEDEDEVDEDEDEESADDDEDDDEE